MKKTKRFIVIALCAVIVACSAVSPVKVYASSDSVNKVVIDIALTKTGVVANQEITERINQKIIDIMGQAIIEFNDWCIANSIDEVDVYAFYDFIQSSDIGESVGGLLREDLISPEYIVECVNKYRNQIQYNVDLVKLFTGKEVSGNGNVELSDEAVDYIRTVFNDYADSDAPYVYVNTLSPENINPLWFTERTHYLTVKDYIANSEYPVHITMLQHTGLQYFSTGNDNTYKAESIQLVVFDKPHGIYRYHDTLGTDNYSILVGVIGEDWEAEAFLQFSQNVSQLGNINNNEYWYESTYTTIFCNFNQETEGYGRAWLATKDGRAVKVFKTLDDYKNYTVGREPYYITTTSGSYNTTDNSVKVSGDYITGSNYQYSHDVVQNEIDNSENVDNSVVNNIVNNNTSTIINNYASSVLPDNGGNGSGSGGGLGSILDGLGSVIGAVTEIVGFLLGVIGDVIGLIGDLFKTIFNGLKALASMFTGFTDLLGEVFGFIPQQLIDFLVLSVEASVGIAIWRKFSKK